MKPIEYCLDLLLTTLEKNCPNFNQRTHLQCDPLLTQMEFKDTYRKHEFFEGLIDKLRKEGFAEFIDENQLKEKDKITFYQENTIITVEGYYLIHNGGYTKKKINADYENSQVKRIQQAQFWLTVILASAAFVASLYYLAELYWNRGWFQSAFWWTIFVVVVFLAALTAYLTTRLLLRKKRQQE